MSIALPNAEAALDLLSEKFHRASRDAGWWDDLAAVLEYLPEPGEPGSELRGLVRSWFLSTKIALIHSEVSEMMEGLRKGVHDDHLPHRSMEEVEAADILIRLFDYAGARQLDLADATTEKSAYNAHRADHSAQARSADGGKKF